MQNHNVKFKNTSVVEKIQDNIFKKMTAGKKVKMVSQFFEFRKNLQKLNNRKIHGNRRSSNQNSKNTR